MSERTAEQIQQEVDQKLAEAVEKDPTLLGEVLSSPIPESFWKMCKTREGAEQLVKSAYAAGMMAAMQDPLGSLQTLSTYLGAEIVIREAPASERPDPLPGTEYAPDGTLRPISRQN